jgi:hypothetical protein
MSKIDEERALLDAALKAQEALEALLNNNPAFLKRWGLTEAIEDLATAAADVYLKIGEADHAESQKPDPTISD